MQRKTLIALHLVISSFFMPFLLLMPITGSLYLLNEKGSVEREVAFHIDDSNIPKNNEERVTYFKDEFKNRGIDFDFEYIKTRGNNLTFRPSSRDHYLAKLNDSGAEVILLKPDFLLKTIELHKGHGPLMFKKLETIFGVGLVLMAISGIWLAFQSKELRTKMGLSFLVGFLLFSLSLIL